MTHVEDDTIQLYLHGELPQAERDLLELHTSACGTCAQLVEEARREDDWVRDRLSVLNTAPPVYRRQVPDAMNQSLATRSLRRAAVIVATVIVGGASIAWGLSAGRPFLERLLGANPPDDAVVASTSEAMPEMVTGIALEPSPRFSVTFDIEQYSGVARLAIARTDTLSVRSSNADASFESRGDEIVIRNSGVPGDYELIIPARAPFVEVRLGRRVVFSRDNGTVRTTASQDATGRYVIQLSSGTPERPNR